MHIRGTMAETKGKNKTLYNTHANTIYIHICARALQEEPPRRTTPNFTNLLELCYLFWCARTRYFLSRRRAAALLLSALRVHQQHSGNGNTTIHFIRFINLPYVFTLPSHKYLLLLRVMLHIWRG